MTYYHNKINNCSDSRALFKTFSSLLCPPPPPPSSTLTADDFATFFTNKTKTISDQFLTPQTNNNFITTNTQSLTSFSPLSETEVSKLILSNHPTTCPLDPIPTHLLQAISSSVIPALTHIINTSLHTGTFPTAFKQARVSPLLKKTCSKSSTFRKTTDRYPSFHSLQSHLSELCSTNSLCSCTEQHSGQQPIWLQKWPLNWDCPTLGYRGPETGKGSFQILCTHLAGSVCCLWHS